MLDASVPKEAFDFKLDQQTIILEGRWTLAHIAHQEKKLALSLQKARPKVWDCSAVEAMDSAAAAFLWMLWGQRYPENFIANQDIKALFAALEKANQCTFSPPAKEGFLVQSGFFCFAFLKSIKESLALIGEVILAIASVLRRKNAWPWKEISANIYKAGAESLGITALVGFLIGIVISYLSAKQLQLFGANIFIVPIVGFSVLRELGPLLAAILVAGRSGSAMTAQFGVMRLTQELDALAAFGISHYVRLVMPKILALSLAMPFVVLWTDMMALLGGIAAAKISLDIGLSEFIRRLPDEVPIANLWLGLAKGSVFGFFIALIASYFGLKIAPNTESLGKGTTNAVVAAITMAILVDAIFAVVFFDVGLS